MLLFTAFLWFSEVPGPKFLSWRVGGFSHHDSNSNPFMEIENFSPGEAAAFLVTVLIEMLTVFGNLTFLSWRVGGFSNRDSK